MAPSLCQATGGMSLASSAREGAPGVALWWPRVPRGGCRDRSSLLGTRQGTDTHGLCPKASPCPALLQGGLHRGGGGCVCPVPEHPAGCHQLVPESVSIPWGHSCHRRSPPAQSHRGRLPGVTGGAACPVTSPALVLPPVPGAVRGPQAWVLWQCVCPLCLSPRVCHVMCLLCLSPRVCPSVFSPTPVRPCLFPVPVPRCLSPGVSVPPVPVPAASRWCQENGQRAEAAGGHPCRVLLGYRGTTGVPGRARGSPRAPSSAPPPPPRNALCFFSQGARPKEPLRSRSVPVAGEPSLCCSRLSAIPKPRLRPVPARPGPGVPSRPARSLAAPRARDGLRAGAAPRGMDPPARARRVPITGGAVPRLRGRGPSLTLRAAPGNPPPAVTGTASWALREPAPPPLFPGISVGGLCPQGPRGHPAPRHG